jgi:hypothetical protein
MSIIIRLILAAGVLFGTAAALRGEDEKPAASAEGKAKRPGREEALKRREAARKVSPQERRERSQQMWERYEGRMKELQTKKTAGTLTDAEGKQLERMEQVAVRRKAASEKEEAKPESKPEPEAKAEAQIKPATKPEAK